MYANALALQRASTLVLPAIWYYRNDSAVLPEWLPAPRSTDNEYRLQGLPEQLDFMHYF